MTSLAHDHRLIGGVAVFAVSWCDAELVSNIQIYAFAIHYVSVLPTAPYGRGSERSDQHVCLRASYGRTPVELYVNALRVGPSGVPWYSAGCFGRKLETRNVRH